MKIAMIGHKRIPSREGGVEVVVQELSTRMVKAGHAVHAYNRMGRHAAKKATKVENHEKTYKGVRLIRIPTINVKSLDALLYSFFASIRALFGGYDCIHYHAIGPSVMLFIPHIFGIRTVVTVHGLNWKSGKWNKFAQQYLLLGEKIAAKYADEVIVLSPDIRQYFLDTYNRQTHYIPNGVSQAVYRKPNRITQEFGLTQSSYVLFLSRLVPGKGIEYLLEAYKNMDTDIRLVVAGGSSHSDGYTHEVKALCEADPRIVMTGFVEGELLEELYSNCAVFVFPSDAEGMPMSVLEAMSYGCRCLVSNITENTQVVGSFGDVFEKSKSNSLKTKLEQMLAEKNPPYTPAQIKEYVYANFCWEDVVQEHLQAYKS